MSIVDIINYFIRNFAIFLCSLYAYIKIINYMKVTLLKMIAAILTCLVLAFAAQVIGININVPIPYIIIAFCFIVSIVMAKLTINKIYVSITTMGVSLGISFIALIISTFLLSFPVYFLKLKDDDIRIVLLIALLSIIIVAFFFKIKRFRNGFQFIHNKLISSIGILFGGAALIISTLLGNYKGDAFVYYMVFSALICGIGIIFWGKRGIKMIFKQQVKDRRIEQLEARVRQLEEESKTFEQREKIIISANHNVKTKLASAETAIARLASRTCADMETASEYAEVLDFIKNIKTDYEGQITKLDDKKKLPSTKVPGIDLIFEHLQLKAAASGIDFNLRVNGSINYMIENVIPLNRLETLIGDHVEDAIIAINTGFNENRRILVMLGEMGNCYAFSVQDSGIPFEVDTLLSLGIKPITTHADTGGSGIGFMTTIETMEQCGASLIIEEKEPGTSNYTKSVTIRFDGKNQYIIKSYRADLIRLKATEVGRIYIEKI